MEADGMDAEELPAATNLQRLFGSRLQEASTDQIQLQELSSSRGEDSELRLRFPRSEDAEAPWFQATRTETSTAALTPSCFSLVLVCALQKVSLWKPMLLITPICAAQFAVLYIISFSSPQYLFASGEWLEPNSASRSLSVMKSFANLLMLSQLAEEFNEISESVRVLRRSRLHASSKHRLALCWITISVQYLLALMVMVSSAHLILSRLNPIEPLWITYYVFMTLNFDNMLLKFIMYVRTMERSPSWKVEVQEPQTPTSRQRQRRSDFCDRLVLLWLPLFLAIAVTVVSRFLNVLPMTMIRYGLVSNERAVVMFSSLSLPDGCCPAIASIDSAAQNNGDTVRVSVPCLARDAPEDLQRQPPIVYWVAWPSRRATPSSLQVRQGRGADGSEALLAGHVKAQPLEMWSWMAQHGYEEQIDEVMAKLTDTDQGGVGMYSRTFPYVAEIKVFPFPWNEEVAIYSIARNSVTGALSPKPAASNILHSKTCPPHCRICDHHGHCRKCEEGFTKKNLVCVACPAGCKDCPDGVCSHCQAGYGWVPSAQTCVPCDCDNCKSCNLPENQKVVPPKVPCTECERGYGLDAGVCEMCAADNCIECAGKFNCTKCVDGFYKDSAEGNTTCEPCGVACLDCRGKSCDRCQEGFRIGPDGDCRPCARHCQKCDETGEGKCDKGACRPGYGPGDPQETYIWQKTWTGCDPCMVPECQRCEKNLDVCDACGEDFGVTPAGRCTKCGMGCSTCRVAGSCLTCRPGWVLKKDACVACSDRCSNCSLAGPRRCNEGGCWKGWTAIPVSWEGEARFQHVCRPCSDAECESCDATGPGSCDDDLDETPLRASVESA